MKLFLGLFFIVFLIQLLGLILLMQGFAFVLVVVLTAFLSVSVAAILALLLRPKQGAYQALRQGLEFFKDSDFSVRLAKSGCREEQELNDLYNLCADALHEEQIKIQQKELLFENVMQNANVLILLADEDGHIFHHNTLAETLLGHRSPDSGELLSIYLCSLQAGLDLRLNSRSELVFNLHTASGYRQCLASRGEFLTGADLVSIVLIKDLSEQFSAKEADVWRTTIKVVSHELNNSIAPIMSMAQSGQMAMAKQRLDSLDTVFSTIIDRCNNLNHFIDGYSAFAKLPLPTKVSVPWRGFIESLKASYEFVVRDNLPKSPGFFDPAQLERVLINVLKNAHDSGSAVKDIELSVTQTDKYSQITLKDRGRGMSDSVLKQALLPFFSTKAEGSGVGLALSREIVRAHGGSMALENRTGGGLKVTMLLALQ
ncbi:sensor histidine kinase [Agaribacterium haliotis]|uniref:sensor histidine kinase n=1 Tax=Agaribacterium haliotis TaxID=2013869 RepID=UPI000BB581FD|nr:ATP-binding protein [Agaribacterium haliotis]